MTDPLTHPGQLCTSGDRAVDLALELGRARVRLARYEAQEARIRALHVRDADLPRYCAVCNPATGLDFWPCPTLAALDEPEAPT